MSTNERDFDLLDCEYLGSRRRWKMYYRDGTVRTSQYRFDLIIDSYGTRITEFGAQNWPESGMDIFTGYFY